jgi:hypothetical protein
VKARISADGRLLPSDDEQGRDSRSRHVRHSPRQRRDSLVLLSNRDRASRHAGQATRFARKQGATRALRPSASARVSVGRAPDPDDTRASGPAPARRLFATTSRRVGRASSSSTVSGRRACRTHVALAAIRATTHVDGKVTLSSCGSSMSRRGRRVGFCIPHKRRRDAGADRALHACRLSQAAARRPSRRVLALALGSAEASHAAGRALARCPVASLGVASGALAHGGNPVVPGGASGALRADPRPRGCMGLAQMRARGTIASQRVTRPRQCANAARARVSRIGDNRRSR